MNKQTITILASVSLALLAVVMHAPALMGCATPQPSDSRVRFMAGALGILEVSGSARTVFA